MEVGAVKQAFNNEIILLKKKLNQAKIQIIHKLTRKAKQLAEKKAPEPLKEKLKRKAESAVKEVLILKKIKPKGLAIFIVTHKGELKDFLNKPTVDNDKACARLLLHKALQDKYTSIRARFSNISIKDLFMSRLDRQKLKKEEMEKRKNKNKGRNNKVVNAEGDWNVEDVQVGDKKELHNDIEDEDQLTDRDGASDHNGSQSGEDNESQANESEQSEAENESDDDKEVEEKVSEPEEENSEPALEVCKLTETAAKDKPTLPPKHPLVTKNKSPQKEINVIPREAQKKKPDKTQKSLNKNKNFNEKIQQRKFKKDSDAHVVGNKIVDPFFITSTGENYMSVVEPRGPDEVREEHKQGNRKLRRAVMFGHVPKTKPRYQNNNYGDGNRVNKQNGDDKGNSFRNKFNNKQEFSDRKGHNNDFNERRGFNEKKGFNNNFNDKKRFNDKGNDEKPEKLHPSWEAKKKKSGILPFEGKKIVFD